MPDPAPGSPRFATTRWSVVLRAGGAATGEAGLALEELCRTYWYPLYAYARRAGRDPDDAQDAVQGLFARLLESGGLGKADPARGRFRTFLLTAFRNHAAKERERAGALKRGGGQTPVSFDGFGDPEERLRLEPAHGVTPERLFERDWARLLIARAMAATAERYRSRGQEAVFAAVRPFLAGGRGERTQAEAAAELGRSEGAFRVAVTRSRSLFRKLLREEVAHTVEAEEEVDAELRALLAALAP